MKFTVITLFPRLIESYFEETILKRALEKKLIELELIDLRQFGLGSHHQVDDRPYGGGPGMILMVEPIAKALAKAGKGRKIMLDPAGKKFTQREAEKLSKYDHLILLSGRYEGFDARVEKLVDEKISIGDYVLAGGELPALVIIETVSRLSRGVVGKEESLKEETFAGNLDYVEYPQYTRPDNYKEMKVPEVLLSGNHKAIDKWRKSLSGKKK